jgi:pimeloyl-ACP methyl ester carboxylesterase
VLRQTTAAGRRASREYRFDAERLRGVDVPTLVLQGGDSADPFKAAAQALQDALPRCRIAVLPGQRHTAMDTAPDLFLAEVLGFLQAPSDGHQAFGNRLGARAPALALTGARARS